MEIQDIIQGLTQAEITAITSPDERSLIVNTTLGQAVMYVNGTFKQASFENTDDIPEGTKKFATSADLSAIAANTLKVSFPEAPSDGKQYARKDAGWEEIASGEPLPVIVLKSNDNSNTFSTNSPLIVPFNLEKYKDSGFSHSNTTNNSRLIVDNAGTYQFGARIRVFNNLNQRAQPTVKIFINGIEQNWSLDTGYIRNSSNASDYWTLEFTYEPQKLSVNDYVQLELTHDIGNPNTFLSTFVGTESSFWGIRLQGEKGEKGDTGSGSNIILKKDGVTVGTVTETIDILGGVPVVDEGGNVTSIEIGNYADATGITQMPSSQIREVSITSGDIDNYDPSTFNVHFINPGSSDRDFTGILAPPLGVNRIITIINSGTGGQLKFKNNDTGSGAVNRILLADQSDFDLGRAGSVQFIYKHSSNRWVTYTYY